MSDDKSKLNGSPPKLHPGRLSTLESVERQWHAELPAGTTPEDIMKPEYWAHLARTIRPMDTIKVFCEDGSWEGLYRVMFVSTAEIRISECWSKSHETIDMKAESESHEIKWISPTKKFGVIRKDDGSVIQDGFYPKEQAQAYMLRHLKELRA